MWFVFCFGSNCKIKPTIVVFSFWFTLPLYLLILHLQSCPSLTLSPRTRVVVNASGAPVLWRLSEEGFLRSSILNGTAAWFLQAPDGLVVPDHLLPLGQNYFLSKTPTISWRTPATDSFIETVEHLIVHQNAFCRGKPFKGAKFYTFTLQGFIWAFDIQLKIYLWS